MREVSSLSLLTYQVPMSTHLIHPYHLVEPRPWPILAGLGAGLLTSGGLSFVLYSDGYPFLCGLCVLRLTATQWWRDVRREATFQGLHTGKVGLNIRWGIGLFILSEVLFFFSFF